MSFLLSPFWECSRSGAVDQSRAACPSCGPSREQQSVQEKKIPQSLGKINVFIFHKFTDTGGYVHLLGIYRKLKYLEKVFASLLSNS